MNGTDVKSILMATYCLSLLPNAVYAQTTDNQANREYGRQTFIHKTTVVSPTNSPTNSSAVREYGSQSLIKSNTNATNLDSQTYVDNLEKKIGGVQGPSKFLGQVVITLTVNNAGTISDAKVTKSSNMPQIDTAALAAIKSSGSFGAIPKSHPKPFVVQVTFDGTSSSTTTHAVVKNP